MPPKLSLTSLICPTAPFLVPLSAQRALRATERCLWPLVISNTYTSHAAVSRRPSKFLYRVKREKANADKRFTFPQRPQEPVDNFRDLVNEGNLDKAMKIYPELVEKSFLDSRDTLAIALLIHNTFRRHPTQAQVVPKILPYAETLVHDIRSKAIPPERAAHVHLISFFKVSRQYDKAYAFWTWLASQSDEYVDQAVYGSAIEMLAYQGTTSLKELEKIYSQALKRFPGYFAEYHLSPEAIVVDKTQPTSIPGLPMTLLQGILTARLLHGDWRNAYLALDVALRLYPTQAPVRFFELFALERPVIESYTVFLVACRAGTVLKPDRLTGLLNRLVKGQRSCSSEDKLALLHGMITAIHAYLGAGGMIEGYHLSSLIKGFQALLPNLSPGTPYGPDHSDNRDLVVSTAKKVVAMFVKSGLSPSLSTFGSLIGLAGKAMLPDMIASTMKDMVTLGFTPDHVIHRAVLTAASQIGDPQLVESSWKSLVAFAEAEGRQPSSPDWRVLAKAAKRTHHLTYLDQQTEELGHAITEETMHRIKKDLNKMESLPTYNQPSSDIDTAALSFHMEMILNQIVQLVELFKSDRLLDFSQSPVPMFLEPSRPALGSIDDLRAVYEELTTDPNQPPPERATTPKTVGPTGLPLDELRFENWVSIHELMNEAELHEEEKQKLVDAAIAAGEPLPKEKLLLTLRKAYPASDSQLTAESIATGSTAAHGQLPNSAIPYRSELRERILILRGIRAAPV
ncbi:uncharacterized protein K441DRAFT_611324 [Cenococcum geophilum 1.58]|uniref:uncharacterized protein n=1 Tax=Cenococcum geophilum 1.58 TaxID=794803 RepID=UPI00358E0AF8|nr:hypothetical protein K441DRAFT_611324 [Cenococcum geophilum 1.58]